MKDSKPDRFNPQDPGDPLPYKTMLVDQKGKNLAYKSQPSGDSQALAKQLATVLISGNIATDTGISGGGIANNGHIIFGEDTPYKIIVKKAWAVDPSAIPDTITLGMYVGDHYIEDVTLTKANQWEATVEDFPDPDTLTDARTGELLPINFREPEGSEYILSIDGYSKDATNRTYTIQLTNSLPPEPTKPSEPSEVEVPPPPSVSDSSPIVFKKIDGGQPDQADLFTFRIEPVSYRPDPVDPRPEPKPFPLPQNEQGAVREVQRSGEGTVSTGQISYTQPGYYEYRIQELDARDGKYTYSTDVHTFVDHVYLQDCQLMVDRRMYKNGLDSNTTTAYFTNLYQGKPPVAKSQITSLPATGASDTLGWSLSLTLMGIACLALIRKHYLR
ncbi:MAG: FctA domain-containing protein [Eubacteriales bacterium]|nr:FctA domain-containing protein [Clostridiales bacterium]MDY5836484.1 FctA domain-containing protein [Eubacteriales bacterium]